MAAEALAERVFDTDPYVYLKVEASQRGEGVRRVTREDFAAALVGVEDAVIQRPLTIHPALSAFSPEAATTLRVTTVCTDGDPARAVAAFLRFGRTGQTHVRAKDQINLSVDLPSGRGQRFGSLPDWTPVEAHSDTGLTFDGFEVPHFRETIRTVEGWHDRFPHVRYIGWDVAIRPDGQATAFEANTGHSGIKFSEASAGPIFAGLGWDRLHERTL